MRTIPILKTLGLWALMAGGYRVWCHLRDGERATPRAKPLPLQTWEGEGGNVPAAREQPATESGAQSPPQP